MCEGTAPKRRWFQVRLWLILLLAGVAAVMGIIWFGPNIIRFGREQLELARARRAAAAEERVEAAVQAAIKRQTVELPIVDKIEILAVGDPQEKPTGTDFLIRPAMRYGGYAPILKTRTVTGVTADELAQLWRSRGFGGAGALCHEPPYALRFYRGTSLVFETSLCWFCFNCFVADGQGDYRWLGFGDRDEELLGRLRELLPHPGAGASEEK